MTHTSQDPSTTPTSAPPPVAAGRTLPRWAAPAALGAILLPAAVLYGWVRVGTGRAGPTAGGTNRPGRTSPSPPLAEGTPICVPEVADQGLGLSPEAAERVFERFYRADPSRSSDHGGSGLGLAIASASAQGHGGRLELETATGHGSVFRLVLPAGPPQ
ncbi:sensor histidine kinase [Streptomyces sp. DT2A-34]|uniref:sensor histidine kinase n=1 Tax=Streptomyces sp. DT2A-34 TaxID=3051182 RepID=UPI00265C808D|nr:sensor histidine kinase [Streptomyces sp. DT2A-34]MDO0910638.1 sensor histidine kinase [Streptomyces sp. DT2A-34]